MSFLRKELARFRLAEREVVVRGLHGAGLIGLIVAVLLIGLIVGWFASGYTYPYRTLPAPKLPPGQKAPAKNCPHTMGACLPAPQSENAASITSSSQGPDLSNNDPVYGDGAWGAIGAHNAFAIFKVNEGTGYVDPTAAAMAAAAKRHGVVVGGYDFLHVCQDSATAEADSFAYHLRADGLTGANTLPGTGDAEYPFGTLACNGRSWIASWAGEVKRLTGRTPMFYTGAWWWQPHLGAYWPAGSLAWVSGYGVRYPYMPSGRSQLDLWQFSDHGWNGVSTADLSIWRDGAAAFRSLTGQAKPKPRLRCFGRHANLKSATCKKVRPALARLSRARDATHRAQRGEKCGRSIKGSCGVLAQRYRYFAHKADALFKQYT